MKKSGHILLLNHFTGVNLGFSSADGSLNKMMPITAANIKDVTIITRPRNDCQIFSQACWTFFGSPPALIKLIPAISMLKKANNPAMIKINLNTALRRSIMPVNCPEVVIPGTLTIGFTLPIGSIIFTLKLF
ncbi:hypothetical protein A3D05_02415 [Candidatus Gottesmanbacteria bacterium RIFCSPHIGHO2_02_FULL_40_24]|uniref:Uncharacterized protein n=1 Tax=Candidatus Gottesmanbacteria bacterium RIFCSPHIGHO2_01_FULL_40_15 TaxID=1798376 RepID=A0A1F5Z3N5_9BACT|nr:MAG: hypothetical protein A2777_03840 [Candidatus Gottesmanbacteria bacterium RIFCSPHIGHO2_01_FULL_40_15]OGG18704.1 MAG: hypothetical protein A3D05_02415 [Candidatus Gottesmanbacteria bacterium RIFCSPHIGHO2_02_FULL_40_24]OGG22996.1 MAG: hypothetical protein A3E42_06625 [Candidatus Gottesmanbacteria bacterium RIFCSPHIGHO2_12_FULL_40_13]OGG23307.1 MAG: hypothetical protein A3B48_06560 [Candidatus Gottesmanbacteria bacterium RIFCSPLOWO2_01_FULL_40_10]OGG31914.1 MAG: hypothetical protein A3I80_0